MQLPSARCTRAWSALLIVAGVGLGAAGCGGRDESRGPSRPPRPPAAAPLAAIEGSVRLAEGFALPSYPPEAMEKKVLDRLGQAPAPASCTPPKITDRQPVRLTDDGLLAGVMLAAGGFSRQPSRAPIVHQVSIRDCRLQPQLVVAMKGDRLNVRNEVDYAFMPALGSDPMVRTLTTGQTYEASLDTPGVTALLCGFTAPCGRTDVIVMLHPLYTVTDAAGHFTIENFPAAESLTLNAWHPLFQEAKLELRVEPGERRRVEIVLTPLPGPAADPGPAGTSKPVR